LAHKKAYSRYFIILQQDENGYSLSPDKLPSGYAKLETRNDKCKISYYVQNLKKDMEPYYMALICNKKDTKKIIKLGSLNIDDYGRAEVTYEYDVNNIAGIRVSVDIISGAAVIKDSNSGIVSVMSGFSTTDIPATWRSYEVYECGSEAKDINTDIEENKVNTAQENSVEVKENHLPKEDTPEQKNIFDEYERKIEQVKESLKENETKKKKDEKNSKESEKIQASLYEKAEEVVKAKGGSEVKAVPVEGKAEGASGEEMEQLEEVVPNASTTETREKVEEDLNKEGSQSDEIKKEQSKETLEYISPDDKYPSGSVGDFFRVIAEDFEQVSDGCKDIKRCKWYRVKVNSMEEMCNTANYNKYTVVYYPMISYFPYIKKFGHYLLGYKYDINGRMKYLVYGVPGTKSKGDQPFGGKSGFVTWVPLKPGDEKEDSFGYWLMFYDFRTSTIVIPMK
jgi:uncharacterized protein YbdZ (MbtH family)